MTGVRFLAALSVAATVGCAALRTMTAPSADYDAYRRYRLAEGFGERLGAAWVYLRDNPQGTFAPEVSGWFYPQEERFFKEAGRTPGGAAAYVAFLPDGPHAEDERNFLRAFQREKVEGPMRTALALEAARKKAEVARKGLGEAIEQWTRRAAIITSWGKGLKALDDDDREFSLPFRYQTPYATCDAEACNKTVSFVYAVPDAQPPEDRTVTLRIRLELDEGRVYAVSLIAPKGGFTWWMEGAENRSIDPTDLGTRREALMRAKNRVEKIVRELRDAKTPCSTAEEPSARTIDCGGLRVVVEPSPNGDDVVRLIGTKT